MHDMFAYAHIYYVILLLLFYRCIIKDVEAREEAGGWERRITKGERDTMDSESKVTQPGQDQPNLSTDYTHECDHTN